MDPSDTVYAGVVMEGHIGYVGEGENIIYATISALVLDLFNSVKAPTEDGSEGGAGESGSFEFRFTSEVSPESKLLMSSLTLGLQNTEGDHGKPRTNVKLKEV